MISRPFSILERIDVGETTRDKPTWLQRKQTFSILERIDVGETHHILPHPVENQAAFSILERIDVGETNNVRFSAFTGSGLSVSSNGSTWVKQTLHLP